jgi:AcrR family transcriptional regulator
MNMDRFERRKERSREDIRRAAEELFAKFGTDKVSVNDIALKAGVSQATIYNNFGNKDNLVHDYRKTIVNAIATDFQGILVWKKSYVEKLHSLLQSWIDIAGRYKIGVEGSNGRQHHASVNAEIEELFGRFIKEGREQGGLRADVSDEAMLTYIKFYQQGIAHNPSMRDRMHHDEKLSHDLFSLFMHGAAGKS